MFLYKTIEEWYTFVLTFLLCTQPLMQIPLYFGKEGCNNNLVLACSINISKYMYLCVNLISGEVWLIGS